MNSSTFKMLLCRGNALQVLFFSFLIALIVFLLLFNGGSAVIVEFQYANHIIMFSDMAVVKYPRLTPSYWGVTQFFVDLFQ